MTDFATYYRKHPDVLRACIASIKVLDVNQAALRHYGARDKSDLMGNIGRILTADSMVVFADQLAAFADGKLVFEAETTDQTLAGKLNHILVKAIVAPGCEHDLSRIYVSMVDITAYKEAETEARVLEEQLRQAQKMDAIGHLAGGIAHDFNNLLTIIHTNTVLMQRKQSSPSLDAIATAASRAADLVKKLLAFSRRQVLETRDLELNSTVTRFVDLVVRIVPANVELRLDLASHSVWTRADASTLDQILMNLVVNARDAMPNGGTLTIDTSVFVLDDEDKRAMPELAPGAYARLRVTDTGSGIPPENLSRIFEPFFTTKDVGKGTGLGLATVFGIVRQQAGAMAVTSEIGRGTTFSILLPAARETRFSEDLPGESSTIVPRGGTESILVVEDEPAVRELVREVLATSGYRVEVVPTGADAIARLSAPDAAFDCVLTDLVMPGSVSGRDVGAWIREHRPTIRVVYTSGYAGTDLPLRIGVTFLPKPFGPLQLLSCIRARLDEPAG